MSYTPTNLHVCDIIVYTQNNAMLIACHREEAGKITLYEPVCVCVNTNNMSFK